MKKTNSDNAARIFTTLLLGFVGCVVVFVAALLVFPILGVDVWYTIIYAVIASLLGVAVVFIVLAAKRMV